MRVRTVGNDLCILVGQYLRRKFLDLVRGNVQGSGQMSLAVAFRCERLNHLDCVLPVEFGFRSFVEIVFSTLTSMRIILC
jgi:hypothetical protein